MSVSPYEKIPCATCGGSVLRASATSCSKCGAWQCWEHRHHEMTCDAPAPPTAPTAFPPTAAGSNKQGDLLLAPLRFFTSAHGFVVIMAVWVAVLCYGDFRVRGAQSVVFSAWRYVVALVS